MDGRICEQTDAEIATIPLRGRLPQIAGPQNTFSAVEFNYPLQLLDLLLSVSLLLFLNASPAPFHHCLTSIPVSPFSHCHHPILSACSSSTLSNLSPSLHHFTPSLTLYGLWCHIDSVTQLITEKRTQTCIPLKKERTEPPEAKLNPDMSHNARL